MPYTPHIEHHFTGGLVVRDTVIGLSDGLTVPFALAAAVTGAVDSTVEHYASEREREELEIEQKPDVEALEVEDLLQSYGLTSEESAPVVAALRKHPEAWRDFMLRFELGLEQPNPRRALTSGVVIGSAYIVGGLIPLGPYFVSATAHGALPWSVGVTLTALAIFGWIKGRLTSVRPARSALQTMLIGGIAAAGAFLFTRATAPLIERLIS